MSGHEVVGYGNNGDMVIRYEPTINWRQERPPLPDEIIKDNEIAEQPPIVDAIFRVEEMIQANWNKLVIVHIVGPSNTSKSTLGATIGNVIPRDGEHLRRIPKVSEKENRRMVVVQANIGHAQDALAREFGKESKDDLTLRERALAPDRITDALRVLEMAFDDHPTTTVLAIHESVGVMAEEDLGRTTLRNFRHYPHQMILAPTGDHDIETKGRNIRNYVIDHRDDPDLDDWLTKNGVHGTHLAGNPIAIKKFIESFGNDARWRVHWTDIWKQVAFNDKYNNIYQKYGSPRLEQFLSPDFQLLRLFMYRLMLPDRMTELGYSEEFQNDNILYIPGKFEAKGVNPHLEEVLGEATDEALVVQFPFPFEVLFDDGMKRPLNEIKAPELLRAMKVAA